MDDNSNDSFDDVLGKLCIPPEPKIPKLTSTDLSSTSSGSTIISTNSTQNNEKKLSSDGKQIVTTTVVTAAQPPNPHCILVHPKQRGNPILKSIVNVPLEFRDIIPDYIIGRTTCILYLSLKYHNLNPDYIYQRLKLLGKQFELRVLLVQVDMPEPYNTLKNLTRISLLADLTLMLAWNAEEAGKIIETYKFLEKRPADLIMEKSETDSHQRIVSALTNIKPVNKTDATILLQNFGNLENIINSTEDRLSLCTGLGPRKAKKLYKTLNETFLRKK